jgi:endonuclease III-like uncharacterized protein
MQRMRGIYMLKNQNLAEQILEIINTGIEAANQMMAFLQDTNLEVFDEVAQGLYQMMQSVRAVADELKAEEDGLTLPAATESIMVSIVRIRGIAKQDREKAKSKIEFELIPLMEEMRVHFYYWGMVYPDPVKMKKYYDEDIHWLACNRYQKEAEESGIYKYDLSIVVLAYNKFDYTKQCIAGLIENLPNEELLIIKDYMAPSKRMVPEKILNLIRQNAKDGFIDSNTIARLLGYEIFENYEEIAVYPRGYRILNKIPRMPNAIVNNLIKTFKSFQHILAADIQKLDEVEGIGEIRARTIKQSLRRMQEQFMFDNLMI